MREVEGQEEGLREPEGLRLGVGLKEDTKEAVGKREGVAAAVREAETLKVLALEREEVALVVTDSVDSTVALGLSEAVVEWDGVGLGEEPTDSVEMALGEARELPELDALGLWLGEPEEVSVEEGDVPAVREGTLEALPEEEPAKEGVGGTEAVEFTVAEASGLPVCTADTEALPEARGLDEVHPDGEIVAVEDGVLQAEGVKEEEDELLED